MTAMQRLLELGAGQAEELAREVDEIADADQRRDARANLLALVARCVNAANPKPAVAGIPPVSHAERFEGTEPTGESATS